MLREVETQFYEFAQNNSGGSFDVDDKVCHRLFIEAVNIHDAIGKALELGVYFDGCLNGKDCSCCGDRWSEPYDTVDINKKNKDGYSVSVYGHHHENAEDLWKTKYGSYEIFKAPKWTQRLSMWGRGEYEGKIVFKDIEEYAQFLADEFGWTIPDCRIFYMNGEVKEFYKN